MPVILHNWQNLATARNLVAERGPVHVWIAQGPDAAADMSADLQLLDGSERLRAERFTAISSRREFVFGRALLRRILGACLKIEPAHVPFHYGPRGKPQIGGRFAGAGWSFNLAHSHALVVIALSWGRLVGVDLEWMGRDVDWPLVARRVFSSSEQSEVRALPEDEQRLAYFTAWTRKEAYLKATGEGLTDEISGIEVTMDPAKPAAFVRLPQSTSRSKPWDIHSLPLPSDFAGALVVESDGRNHTESPWPSGACSEVVGKKTQVEGQLT
ncbi:MAG: 4'-phosphopantetheinyl transferase superfamily protein [Terrimicrobiaceae bacterium]